MYRIIGACVQATVGGTRKLFYPPAGLPDDVPQSEIKHLLSVKLIEKVEDLTEALPADVVGLPVPSGEATATGDTGSTEGGDSTSGLPADAPRGNASTEDWRAYAVSKGMAEEQVANMSRDEIKAELAK